MAGLAFCLQRESCSVTQMLFRLLFCRGNAFVERRSHLIFFPYGANFSISLMRNWSVVKSALAHSRLVSSLIVYTVFFSSEAKMEQELKIPLFALRRGIMTLVLNTSPGSGRLLRRGIPTLIPSKWNHLLLTRRPFFSAFQWHNCPPQCFQHSTLESQYFLGTFLLVIRL